VSLSGGSLAANASCTVSVNVAGTAAGTQDNSVTVSSNQGTGNTSMAFVTVTPVATVAPPVIAKSFGVSSIMIGQSTVLSFTLSNPAANTVALTGVSFTDPFPAGLIVATPSGVSGSCGGAFTANAGSRSVSLSGGSLGMAGGACTVAVNVTGSTPGVKMNSVAVTSANGGAGNTSTAVLTVVGPPSIAEAFGVSNIPQGGTTSLTFTITNPNVSPLTGIAFTDTLPSQIKVSNPNGLTDACGGTATATAGSGSVTLTGGTIPGKGSCTLSLNVVGVQTGMGTNSVPVTSNEGGTGNTASAPITVSAIAPPAIMNSFGAASVALKGSTTLSFNIANPSGNTASLTGIGFTDTLPGGLVVSTPNALTGSCGGGALTASAGSGTVSLTGGTLTTGAMCTFSVNVTGTTAGAKSDSVTVTSTNGGAGNTATATLTVFSPPSIAKAFGSSNISIGGMTNLTFTVTNSNASPITGVIFTDTFPSQIQVASPTGLANTCGGTATAAAGSSSVALTGGSIPGNGLCTVTVNIVGAQAGAGMNSVSETSNEGGAGNTASAAITVSAVTPPPATGTCNVVTPGGAWAVRLGGFANYGGVSASIGAAGQAGILMFDGMGHVTFTGTTASEAQISRSVSFSGTYSVAPDCALTLVLHGGLGIFYNAVLVSGATEFKIVDATGGNVEAGVGKRISSGSPMTCNNATANGTYGFDVRGYTGFGSTNGPQPFAGAGKLTFDGAGHLTYSETYSAGQTSAIIVHNTGAYSVNSDCSVSMVLQGGPSIFLDGVLANGATEILMIDATAGNVDTGSGQRQ
jgi:uncharacterized repeat protein (TIGR01451 family)